MEQEVKHAAIIRVDFKTLLKALDFEGAIFHRVYTPNEYLNPDYFCIVIEHPDLPEIRANEHLTEITPIMQVYYGDR